MNTQNLTYPGLGYLIWVKIPFECLLDPRLPEMVEKDLSKENDPLLIRLHLAKEKVLEMIEALSARNISHVRTGAAWAEWHSTAGSAWILWYLKKFAEHFEVLPNLTFTPPDIAEVPQINAPPKRLVAFAEFVHEFLTRSGAANLRFEAIELWNEWDLITDWNPKHDPDYQKFLVMITMGAIVARHHKVKTVLGGVSGVRDVKLERLERSFARAGLFEYIDVVGMHNLRGTWGDKLPAAPLREQAQLVKQSASIVPDEKARVALFSQIRKLAYEESSSDEVYRILLSPRRREQQLAVWLTEYGFPTADPTDQFDEIYLEEIQVVLFANALRALEQKEVDRVYWYTLRDLRHESVRKRTTGWEDVLQFYYGDTKETGELKFLGRLLLSSGAKGVLEYVSARNRWHLVDKASLPREIPEGYHSQAATALL